MSLTAVISEFREQGAFTYDNLDENAKKYTYDEKIVALSGYFEKYVLMDTDELQEKLEKNNLKVSDDDAENVIELVLFEEEETLFEITEKKNKTDPYILLKCLIIFPEFTRQVYLSSHKLSLRNIILVTIQMIDRNLSGPVRTFNEWKELGAKVRKGEKGIGVIVPNRVNVRRRGRGDNEEMVYFNFRKMFFAQSQVDPVSEELDLNSLKKDVKTKDELFDNLADKFNVDLDLSEQEILKTVIQGYPRVERPHLYNFCALLTGVKTKDVYDTIAFVNETPARDMNVYLNNIANIFTF